MRQREAQVDGSLQLDRVPLYGSRVGAGSSFERDLIAVDFAVCEGSGGVTAAKEAGATAIHSAREGAPILPQSEDGRSGAANEFEDAGRAWGRYRSPQAGDTRAHWNLALPDRHLRTQRCGLGGDGNRGRGEAGRGGFDGGRVSIGLPYFYASLTRCRLFSQGGRGGFAGRGRGRGGGARTGGITQFEGKKYTFD